MQSWFLERRRWLAALVVALTAVLVVFAGKVPVDFSIELVFPRFDKSRVEYEAYRKDFPFDDAQALVVVEAKDLFTPAGYERLKALEDAFAALPSVADTQGLATAQHVIGDGDVIRLERLVEGPPTPDALAEARRLATTDPLLHHWLATPDGGAAVLRLTLSREVASKEETRTAFLKTAREILQAHDERARGQGVTQKTVLSGLPVIRSAFTELVQRDFGTLVPLAFAMITALLFVAFRRKSDVLAAVLTIVAAVTWTQGFLGVVHIPIQVMTQATSIIVMIISISDTVHIVSHFREELAHGLTRPQAAWASVRENAIPCLLTEITIAAGFASLVLNDMVMIQQFGIATAAGMLLTWLANVTVLPLLLGTLPTSTQAQAERPAAQRLVRAVVDGVEAAVTKRPRVVVASAVAILAALAWSGTHVGKEYFSYDDLRPGSPLAQDIRYLESTVGGSVPLAIHIRKKGPGDPADAMLEPEALRAIDHVTTYLEAELGGDVKNAASLSKIMRQAHRALAGDELADQDPLPASRRLAAQELLAIDDPRLLRDIVNGDRSAAAIVALVPDRGSSHASAVLARLRGELQRRFDGTPYEATVTGIYGIADGIYRSLVGGLVASLAGAVVVSLVVFWLVLRSASLAFVALVPNVVPLVLTLGIMSLLGIDVKPSTVTVFSSTLVIADDDTIQFLARFRRRLREELDKGTADAHRVATLSTLRDSGHSMIVTTAAVALGFLCLLPSQFMGTHNLGLLIAVSLVAALVADLFLTPILLLWLKPKLGLFR